MARISTAKAFGFVLVAVAIAVFVTLYATGVITLGGGTQTQAIVNQPTGNNNVNANTGGSGINTAQPTASYSTIDKFSTSAITGTSYYKPEGQKAQTTALTNVNDGTQYTYWVDNGSTGNYVEPAVFTAHTGANPIQATGWQNASASITAYDNVASTALAKASHNVTLGASGTASVTFKYQGTSKKTAGPFGGVMVLEYNNSISGGVVCTSDYLQSSNPFHVTYQVSDTQNTFQMWAYSSATDDGTGKVRNFDCQLTNGASAQPSGEAIKISFIPADYYVTNDGNIVLDTEQYLNGVNTRTGDAAQTETFYTA